MKLTKYNTKEHKDILRVFAHSSKIEKKVYMNLAYELNKLKESDWKGKGLYPIEIPIETLTERTDSSYRAIKNICRKVVKKTIEMKIPHKLKNGKQTIFDSIEVIFPSCGIDDNVFKIEVKETVIPLFSRALERYRHYNIIEAKFLTHKHSIEIYKFLKDKQNQNISDFTISIKDFKIELGLECKYKLYADCKKWVIEPAKKDMKNNSVLWFEYKEIKRSRSVTDLIFYIHANKEKEQDIYITERIRIYTKSTTEERFKIDFLHFLEADYCFSNLSKTIDYSNLEKAKLSLKTKTTLKDYSLKIQKQFIEFLEPSIL
jgi:plasmid replication initiation protein